MQFGVSRQQSFSKEGIAGVTLVRCGRDVVGGGVAE